jgi:hypothetical protein
MFSCVATVQRCPEQDMKINSSKYFTHILAKNKRFRNVWLTLNNPTVNVIITTVVVNENRK